MHVAISRFATGWACGAGAGRHGDWWRRVVAKVERAFPDDFPESGSRGREKLVLDCLHHLPYPPQPFLTCMPARHSMPRHHVAQPMPLGHRLSARRSTRHGHMASDRVPHYPQESVKPAPTVGSVQSSCTILVQSAQSWEMVEGTEADFESVHRPVWLSQPPHKHGFSCAKRNSRRRTNDVNDASAARTARASPAAPAVPAPTCRR